MSRKKCRINLIPTSKKNKSKRNKAIKKSKYKRMSTSMDKYLSDALNRAAEKCSYKAGDYWIKDTSTIWYEFAENLESRAIDCVKRYPNWNRELYREIMELENRKKGKYSLKIKV